MPPYPNRPGSILPKPRQVGVMPKPEPKQMPVDPVLPPLPPAALGLLKEFEELKREVQTLRKMVEACAGREGPQGKQGLRGETGQVGPTPKIDLDALAAKLRAQMPAYWDIVPRREK